MSGPDTSKLFERKQTSIEKISATKSLGMELANAYNNATAVYIALLAHPCIDPTRAAQEIMEWVQFFLGLKDEVKPELSGITADQAIKETEKVFEPQKTFDVPCSEPQTKKIWVELHRLGHKDENHLHNIQMILDLSDLKSMKDLTRKQASTVIEKLMKMEAKK
jgi:hypothetical protein